MQPRFVFIKSQLLDDIAAGDMKPGDKIPSENQLAEQCGVSRMTARRAITELVNEGILVRSQGLGTFVSDHRPMSSMLAIRSIHDEVTQRGHIHRSDILRLESIPAIDRHAVWLGVAAGEKIFRSLIVHWENDQPIQLEDRLVNPQWAPDYLEQDFTQITANQYLSQVAPLTEADHTVEALCASAVEADSLHIEHHQPCLKVSRRTYSAKGIVSYATLLHPGNRYRLGGHIDF